MGISTFAWGSHLHFIPNVVQKNKKVKLIENKYNL